MLRRDGESLNRLQGGFLPVDYMLEHVALKKRKVKRADLLTILRGGRGNWKMRFKSNVDEQGKLWVASWGGHSAGFKETDDDIPPNREATSLGNGTEWIHLDSITDVGLPRCPREHIHLVDIPNAARREIALAHLKRSAEILATIDTVGAREAMVKFFYANNGIIATRRFPGTIPYIFATSVIDIRTGEMVYDKEADPHWVFQKEK